MMKIKRKITSIAVTVATAFILCACDESSNSAEQPFEDSSASIYFEDPESSSASFLIEYSSSLELEISSSTIDLDVSSSSFSFDFSSSSNDLEISSSSRDDEIDLCGIACSNNNSSSSEEVLPQETFKEDFRDECTIGNLPKTYSNAKLPNPFTMLDGTPVSSLTDWKCRREELAALLEEFELGEKPRHPEKVTGSYANGKLTVTVTDNGNTISFNVGITGAGSAQNPRPAMIGFNGGSLGNSYAGLGIASISFNPDDIAPESRRGSGNFYKLYGQNHSAGTLIAWAWGISRVIDALAVTPEAGIDVHHLGVTGCSRLGKGALVAGAFDARIALVIPQESGSGGASNWRNAAKDSEAQPLSSACTEAAWFRSSLCNYQYNVNGLPTDHHFLTGMVAPHGLLVLDNTGWVWLGENASYANAMSTFEIFKFLGAEKDFTYSKAANHMHCSFPDENTDEVQAFVKKYLLDDASQNTGKIEAKGVYYNVSDWQDWTVPTMQ